jgi:hypothetical protein
VYRGPRIWYQGVIHILKEDEAIHRKVDDKEDEREDEKPEEAGSSVLRGRGVEDSIELTAVLVEARYDEDLERL